MLNSGKGYTKIYKTCIYLEKILKNIFGNECFYGLLENQIDVLQTGCQKKDTNLLFKAELNNLAIQFCNEIPQ
jgi:hypothetical protein